MVCKEKQINVLLKGNSFRFACEQLGITSISDDSYSKVFDVTRQEVLDYVLKNGIPYDYSYSRNSLTDGFKFFEEDGKWYCFFRERTFVYDEKEFDDYEEGLIYITDVLLKMTGTGLF